MKQTKKARGRLIALEGTGGRSMATAVKQLARSLRQGKIVTQNSLWDDSDLFFQISQGPRGLPAPPPETLVLLYATDLAFRLRWQIQPALDAGFNVIAAPYLETVIGFGRGAGLPAAWLRGIFQFAPPVDDCYRVAEGVIPADRRGTPANSFLEFCLAQLRAGPASWDTEAIRRGFLDHLARLEARGKCQLATAHLNEKKLSRKRA